MELQGLNMNIDDKTKAALVEAEQSVKAVWEIDGVTVYIRDLKINKGNVVVDWFTFNEDIDKTKLGIKVEDLARLQLNKEVTCSSTLFSRIWSSMKRTFV